MPRTDLYLKVEIEHDEHDKPELLGAEICRAIQRRIHGVISAELSSFVTQSETE